jgi:hypothetical protein
VRQLTSGTALHGTALPGSFVHVLGGTDLLLLALAGLAIAIAGALGPASWAARAKTTTVLHTDAGIYQDLVRLGPRCCLSLSPARPRRPVLLMPTFWVIFFLTWGGLLVDRVTVATAGVVIPGFRS